MENKSQNLDKENNNTLQKNIITKEIHNIYIIFQILENNEPMLHSWKQTSGHMIYDLKIYFTRKTRWVLDENKCPDFSGSIYIGVVSKDNIIITLIYIVLNKLNMCITNIKNIYL